MGSYGVNHKIRDAIVAGIFYPEDPSELADTIDAAMSASDTASRKLPGEHAVGILAPHSAFDFSGAIQAGAWAAAAGLAIDHVVILAPYRTPGTSVAYLPESSSFKTPLGDIEVDTTMCEELESYCTLFSTNDIPHLEDHSIEVQLPYMRRLFPAAKLVPILIGGDAAVAGLMARSIDLTFGSNLKHTLVVISSNLASSMAIDEARMSSEALLSSASAHDWRAVASRRDVIGAAAIASGMATSTLDAARYELLGRIDSHRQNSRITARVVEYAAIAWFAGGAA
jgi:AmmeMemoRadiSam system protein B